MESSHPAGALTSVADGQRPKLLDQVRARMYRLGLAKRTEEAYVGWIRRFILANGKRHPRDMGEREVESFLTNLAVRGRVAASTQTQALSALLFLYREVLGVELPWMENIRRAKRPERVPVVLSRNEARALLGELSGVNWLMASLLYGSGLRLLECLRLRVQDVDFGRREITVRHGKGGKDGKDRRTVLPQSLVEGPRFRTSAVQDVSGSGRQRFRTTTAAWDRRPQFPGYGLRPQPPGYGLRPKPGLRKRVVVARVNAKA